MRLIAVLAVLALPAVAHAQGMDCRAAGGGRNVCTESFRSLTDRLDRRAEGRETSAHPREGGDALTPAQRRLVAGVAKAIRAGRCDDARALALAAGDYPLADHAGRLCAPRPVNHPG